MRFYYINDSYFTQIEGWSLVGFRFGYTAMGLAWSMAGRKRPPKWSPHVRLTFWSHTGSMDRRVIFRVQVGRHFASLTTRGECGPSVPLCSFR